MRGMSGGYGDVLPGWMKVVWVDDSGYLDCIGSVDEG